MRIWIFAASFITSCLVFTLITLQRPQIKARYFSKIEVYTGGFYQVFVGARLGRSDKKFLVNPRKDPALIPSIFPGYGPELAADQNLWRNYFRREFEIKVTSAYLSRDSEFGMVIYQSFTGCFDVIRRYGADILIIGASDVAQDIPPDELARFYPDKKILMCAAPTLTPDAMVATLELLERIYPLKHRKPELVILGMSRNTGYLSSPFYQPMTQSKLVQLQHYKQADFLGHYAYLNQTWRLPWTWNLLFPIRRDANHLPLVNRIAHPERWSLLDIDILREDYDRDPRAFDEKRRNNPQKSSLFLGVEDDPGCRRLKHLPKLFKSVQEHAARIGDTVLMFTTPTMGDELREAPPCYTKLYDYAMNEPAATNVILLNGGMEFYGLTPLDFAFQDGKGGNEWMNFDVAHPNFEGGQKITAKLVSVLREKIR